MGHSFAQILYRLELLDQDTVTGQYRRGYIPSTVSMVIIAKGTSYRHIHPGFFGGKNALAITDNDVNEGDVVKDNAGFYYTVLGRSPVFWGTTFGWYECPLKEKTVFDCRIPSSGASPASEPNFFGFESITPGENEFEDGFEKGYRAN